jgi:hypothetical protein
MICPDDAASAWFSSSFLPKKACGQAPQTAGLRTALAASKAKGAPYSAPPDLRDR